MNVRQLLQAFERWRVHGGDLVLATVYDTVGSTYSKAGAQMLIDAEGNFQGMLSGGCLEGDLAERAANVLATGNAQAVTYDLRSNDEELWGLGVGCEGLMRIFLQPLSAGDAYEPFTSMAGIYAGDEAGVAVTVIESEDPSLPPGASLVSLNEAVRYCSEKDAAAVGMLQEAGCGALTFSECRPIAAADATVLLSRIAPPPRVLVLGGGLDAQPVVAMISELGWRVCVQDHRPAYLEKGDFGTAEEVSNFAADVVGVELDLARFDAAIVMSHHLQTDRSYLNLLAETEMKYIGLLGPVDRRKRLLADLGNQAYKLDGRLHGPAGIDIGGRGPAAIALSIVAEMHQQLLAGR